MAWFCVFTLCQVGETHDSRGRKCLLLGGEASHSVNKGGGKLNFHKVMYDGKLSIDGAGERRW